MRVFFTETWRDLARGVADGLRLLHVVLALVLMVAIIAAPFAFLAWLAGVR